MLRSECVRMILFQILTLPVFCAAAATHFPDESYAELSKEEHGPPAPCVSGDGGGCAVYDDCSDICGCDRSVDKAYFYNETSGNCELSRNLQDIMIEKYNNEEKIRAEAERVFAGVTGAAIFFVTCACIFLVAACVYCCRMNYSDYALKEDVLALAKKQGRKLPVAPPARPQPNHPSEADTCTIVVDPPGICVIGVQEDVASAGELPESDFVFNMNSTIPYQYTKKEVPYKTTYNRNDMIDLVIIIALVLAVIAAIFAACCYCMNRSDKKLQKYVLALAKRRGRKIDKKQLKRPSPPSQGPMAESCPVLLADAGIIIP